MKADFRAQLRTLNPVKRAAAVTEMTADDWEQFDERTPMYRDPEEE
jgi:hypothetical protein